MKETLSNTSVPKNRYVQITGFLAALGGLLFGLDVGVIAGALPFINQEFQVSDHTLEWIVSALLAGAAIGALLAGWQSHALGRKKTLLISAVIFLFGALFCAFAWSPDSLIAARFVLGLAVGGASFTAPVYISEVAPRQYRGAMISVYQLMVTIGILCAFLSNTALSYSGSWRWMLGVIAIPAALFMVGTAILPESPRWLLMRKRDRDAEKILIRLRTNKASVNEEVSEIKEQLRIPQQGWSLFRSNQHFRRSVFLGIILQVMQQLTGINVIIYYAPRVFELAGYTDITTQMWGTVLVGVINVLATFIAIGFIDRWGRKPILYAGFFIMGTGLGILGYLLTFGKAETDVIVLTVIEQKVAVLSMLSFIIGFAMSAGPLVWTLCSEIQPIKGRDFGITVSTVTSWVVNMIVGASFLTLMNTLGGGETILLYAGMNLFFIILVALYVPETKGETLENIERRLLSGVPLRDIGN
ncbi:sugar porter family MFS transporter [Klebsiella variicola]|uniref:sugar porter family MFS transporter n=1 Tax=Klebsiella variicola TaxID=244366 RepID=UPI001C251333|nr:sugar porter family MFS transporter [Klebsiella variicola]MBU9731528.1 sugar porter family MFS transporter [Klebsiella variicola]